MMIFSAIFAQEKTFYLKSGDKVSGTITSETDDTYVVTTSFGSVTIQKTDIIQKKEETFYLKSGDEVSGIITTDTDSTYVVKAAFGLVTIQKADLMPKKVVGFQDSFGSIDYYQMGYDQAEKDIKAGDWDEDKGISIASGVGNIFFLGAGSLADAARGVNVPDNNEVSQNGKSEYEAGYKKRIKEGRLQTSSITCVVAVIGSIFFLLIIPSLG